MFGMFVLDEICFEVESVMELAGLVQRQGGHGQDVASVNSYVG